MFGVFRKRRRQPGKKHEASPRYGDEVLCAGWNPVAPVIGEPPMPDAPDNAARDPAQFDADAFLSMLYALQRT